VKKVFIFISLLVTTLLLSGCGLKKTTTETLPNAEPTPVPTKPIEQSIKERPYVSLLPTADRHWVTMEIKKIPQDTKGLDYDLTYFADFEGSKIERGVSTGGVPVDLNGATEYSKKVLFGSASCTTGTCKYKYDENVTEGALSIKFVGGEKYETAYRIQKGKEAAADGFSTGDGVFMLKASLPTNSVYLIASSIGLLAQLPPGVIAKSLPYAVFPSFSGKATVSFKTDLSRAVIYAYNSSGWQKLATIISDNLAKAESSGASLFILAQ